MDEPIFDAGLSLGPEADILVAELIKIAQSDDFLSKQSGSGFNDECRHIRAREIGVKLNEMGGLSLMQAVYYKVRTELGGSGRGTLILGLEWS
jgi:hypothetical protein